VLQLRWVAAMLLGVVVLACASSASPGVTSGAQRAGPVAGLAWIESDETPPAMTFFIVWETWNADRTQVSFTPSATGFPTPQAADAAAQSAAHGDAYWIVEVSTPEAALGAAHRIRTPVALTPVPGAY